MLRASRAHVYALTLLFGYGNVGPLRAAPRCSSTREKHCAQALVKGEAAPFTGILLTNELALRLEYKIATSSAAHAIDKEYWARLRELDRNHFNEQRALDQFKVQRLEQELRAADEQLTQLEQRSAWQTPLILGAVVLALGVAAGVGIGVAGALR